MRALFQQLLCRLQTWQERTAAGQTVEVCLKSTDIDTDTVTLICLLTCLQRMTKDYSSTMLLVLKGLIQTNVT